MIYCSKARLPEQYELCLDHTFCKCNFFVRVADLLICHLLDGITCALAEILLNLLMLTQSMPKPMALNCINRDIAYCCTHTSQRLLPHAKLDCFSILKSFHKRRVGTQEGVRRRPGSPAHLTRLLPLQKCWRGSVGGGRRRSGEGKERRRVSGADRQQTWQQHFLRWAILNSLSYLLTLLQGAAWGNCAPVTV